MRIALVTGSYPPDVCGAGDYTERLSGALEANGVAVEVITRMDWRLLNARTVLGRIQAAQPDITHIQYPTVGYGRNLGPHVIGLVQRDVVTLHEASQTHVLRQLSLYPLLLSRHVIFTNLFEQRHVVRLAPWLSGSSSIIPIGSNIPVGRACHDRNSDEILYFGLIRPDKGIEQVLELARLLQARGANKTVRIVGLPLKEHQNYFDHLKQASASLPIVWSVGLSDEAVAELLAKGTFAFAPFPDGASERRGSLLALLANGVATVTTRGSHTPSSLDDVVTFAASTEDAFQAFTWLSRDAKRRAVMAEKGREYAARFSWSVIADQHIALYRSLVARKRAQYGKR